MDNTNSSGSMSTLVERFGVTKRDKSHKDKDHRLSKADIGGPISTTEKTDGTDSQLGVLRCVIVHKDEYGYGLTVSGDNPVYVQSIKEDGAAYRAGVRQGDRIVNVNGTRVTEYNHIEVVKLIKSGVFVNLTLFGKPLGLGEAGGIVLNSSAHNMASNVSQPAASNEDTFFNEKVSTIKKMLKQESSEVERIKEEYAKQPNSRLLNKLRVAQKLKQDLEKQLWKAESAHQNQVDINIFAGGQEFSDNDTGDLEGITVYDSEEILDNAEKRNSADVKLMDGQLDIMHGTDDSFSNNTNMDENQQNPNIMNFEEDDLAGESEAFRDHGPFNDFEKLRTRQAHMAVFIKYVFTHHDPCSLLLILAVDGFKALTSTKEMLKTADNICKTYISPNAVLKVKVDEGIAKSINDTIHAKNLPDDTLRTVFNPAVQPCLKNVQQQLGQFCLKRVQGLGSLFGEDKLTNVLDHAHEIKVVEEVISNLVQDLASSAHVADSPDAAKAEALQSYLSQVMGKRKSKISKIGSMLRPRTTTATNRNRVSGSMESLDEPNKRTSMFINKGKRKTKTPKEGAIIPVVQPSHPTLVQPESDGVVSKMISIFQDDGTSDNNNLTATDNHRRGTGSFQKVEDKQRSRTNGKSNSDPDAHTVEKAVSEHSHSTDSIDMSQSTLSTSSSMSAAFDISSLPYDPSDEELQVEPETNWSAITPPKVVKNLDKKEVKRQEIIFELLHTERHHVRDLKILHLLFYERMLPEKLLTKEELDLVFPNLEEILEMHRELNTMFQKVKKSSGDVVQHIGDTLIARFDNIEGKKFKEECAKYCGNQSVCLDFIKERCKKDQRFNQFIQNAERYPICRRLQLKDFIPMEFQRLTKYPLLLDNIVKNTKKKEEEEVRKIKRASEQCKVNLSYVNKAVKDAEDHQKIVEIQNNLDASPLQKVIHPIVNEYKNINLLERTLIHQGPLVWKLNQNDKKKSVDLHCVVFDDVIVLLQRQDEKYVLKCHNTGASKDEKALVHPPILKLSKVLVRNVATDKKAFFIVSTSELGPQMYELVAKTQSQMQEWLHLISETAEVARKKEAQNKPIHKIAAKRRDGFSVPESSREESILRKRQPSKEATKPRDSMDASTPDDLEEDVGTLEEILQPPTEEISIIDRIQHKHEEIFAAITFKHKLLAEHAGLDDDKLDEVLDMALTDSEPDPHALVMHSLLHADKLTTMINDLMQPDTVFLQPPQSFLHPQESSSSSSSNTATPVHSAQLEDGELPKEEDPFQITEQQLDIVEETEEEVSEKDEEEEEHKNEEKDEKWAELVVHPASEDEQESIKEEDVVEDNTKLTSPINTPDRRSTASLDIVMSDYETASESASAPEQSDVNSYSDDNQQSDTTTASALLTDTGIGTQDNEDAASDNTLSAIDPEFEQSTTSLVGDLLSFDEPAIAPPDHDGSTMPLSPNTEQLMAKTEPVRLGKMLEITCNLQAQLTQLLRAVKLGEAERTRLLEEIEQLRTGMSELQDSPTINQPSTEDILSPPQDDALELNTISSEPENIIPSAPVVPLSEEITNNDENEVEDSPPTYASVVSDNNSGVTMAITNNQSPPNIYNQRHFPQNDVFVEFSPSRNRSYSEMNTSTTKASLSAPKSTGF